MELRKADKHLPRDADSLGMGQAVSWIVWCIIPRVKDYELAGSQDTLCLLHAVATRSYFLFGFPNRDCFKKIEAQIFRGSGSVIWLVGL